jgi:hypothetical protein
VVLPLFKAGKIYFPVDKKTDTSVQEFMNEISLAARSGFRSKHDDFLDTVSQLPLMNAWKPTETGELSQDDETGLWEMDDEDEDVGPMSSYIV